MERTARRFRLSGPILRLGGERGMVRSEKLFLTLNTLPMFDRLLDILDSIPWRGA